MANAQLKRTSWTHTLLLRPTSCMLRAKSYRSSSHVWVTTGAGNHPHAMMRFEIHACCHCCPLSKAKFRWNRSFWNLMVPKSNQLLWLKSFQCGCGLSLKKHECTSLISIVLTHVTRHGRPTCNTFSWWHGMSMDTLDTLDMLDMWTELDVSMSAMAMFTVSTFIAGFSPGWVRDMRDMRNTMAFGLAWVMTCCFVRVPWGIAPQRAIWTLGISRHILSTTMSGINSISHNFDAWCLNLSELSFPHCVVAFKHRCSSAQDWHPCLCPLLLGSFQMIKFQLSPPAFGAVCRTDRTRSKADSCGACQNAPKNMRGPWLSHVRKPTSQDCTTAYCCYSFYNNEHYRNPCPEWLSGLPA